MSRSGCVMPRASHRAITSAMTAAIAPASRNCHQTLCRNPSVAEMRPSAPRVGEGYSTMRLPPSSVGIDAQTLLPITPHLRHAPWRVRRQHPEVHALDRDLTGDGAPDHHRVGRRVRDLTGRDAPREGERVDRLGVAR